MLTPALSSMCRQVLDLNPTGRDDLATTTMWADLHIPTQSATGGASNFIALLCSHRFTSPAIATQGSRIFGLRDILRVLALRVRHDLLSIEERLLLVPFPLSLCDLRCIFRLLR